MILNICKFFKIKNKKVVLVINNELSLYKMNNNKYEEIFKTNCYIGKNGYSIDRKSGDYTTPVGIYKLLYAFGFDDKINSKLPYKRITEYSYFCDDVTSKYYNKWVNSKAKIIGEHLIDYKEEYQYGIVFDFNMHPVIQGKGSSIFIHVFGKNKYTAGCIAISKEKMIELLKHVDKKTCLVIIPNKDFIKE